MIFFVWTHIIWHGIEQVKKRIEGKHKFFCFNLKQVMMDINMHLVLEEAYVIHQL